VRFFLLIVSFCLSLSFLRVYSQTSNTASPFSTADSGVLRHRTKTLAIAGGTVYAVSMTGLYQLWYRDYPQSGFHFINDNSEWMSMDKLGHLTTSYYIGRLGYDAWRWAGMNENKSIWIGGLSGFFYLTAIEILDGFSAEWGASTGDLVANTMGSALFISQQLAWHQQKVLLKWSYHPTAFPHYRPDLLGSNSIQQVIKDYNGQTYWLSANLRSFSCKESRIPKWLNLAVGYRSTGMTGAGNNPTIYEGIPIPSFQRKRLLYIAPDIDLTRIHTHSTTLKWVFEAIGFLKFPLPALEISSQKAKFRLLYF